MTNRPEDPLMEDNSKDNVIERVSKRPTDFSRIRLTTLKTLGYPIQFQGD